MRNLNVLNQFRQSLMWNHGDSGSGFFIIPRNNNTFYQVVASSGSGWDHVSVCLLDRKGNFIERTVTWDEMCLVKEMLFNDDEAVIEIHTSDEFEMYEKDYTIDLWKPLNKEMPLPNPDLVGKIKKYPNK